MNNKLNYTEEYYMEKYGVNGIYFRFTPDPIEGVTFEEIAQVFKNTYIARFFVRRNEDKNRYDGILLNQDNFQLCIDTDEMHERITGEVTVMREDPEIIDYMANRNVSGSVGVRDIDEESQDIIFSTSTLWWND
jgi:hypothetical protein